MPLVGNLTCITFVLSTITKENREKMNHLESKVLDRIKSVQKHLNFPRMFENTLALRMKNKVTIVH